MNFIITLAVKPVNLERHFDLKNLVKIVLHWATHAYQVKLYSAHSKKKNLRIFTTQVYKRQKIKCQITFMDELRTPMEILSLNSFIFLSLSLFSSLYINQYD